MIFLLVRILFRDLPSISFSRAFELSTMIEKLHKILAFTDPSLFYYAIIYGVTKTIETLIGSERNFWQSVWFEIFEICGENEAFYLTLLLPLYTYGLYWLIGGIFLIMENKIKAYKIQSKIGEVAEAGKLMEVSLQKFMKFYFLNKFFARFL